MEPSPCERRSESAVEEFSPLFYPTSIAFYGASSDPSKIGSRVLTSIMDFGYRGRIYIIHPHAERLRDIRCYRSLGEVGAHVDYAYIAVPPTAVGEAVDDCAGRVRFAHILTSGFAEIGEEGRRLQDDIVRRARAGRVRLIGPNCMGCYCPESGLTFIEKASSRVGRAALISQSGGLANDAIRMGPTTGLHYSKVISIGNSADLDASDFLEYFAEDQRTSVVGLYVESVKDGRRFARVLKKVTGRVPVAVLKGGRDATGASASALHTGALAGNYFVWRGVLEQHGAIVVESFEELLGFLSYLSIEHQLPVGDKLLVVGQGGGATVLAADACSDLELYTPRLEERVVQALLETGLFRTMLPGNPMDTPVGVLQEEDGRALGIILDTILARQEFSLAIVHINLQNVFSYAPRPESLISNAVESVGSIRRTRQVPVILVLRSNGESDIEHVRAAMQVQAADGGLVVCPTTPGALRLARHVIKGSLLSREALGIPPT